MVPLTLGVGLATYGDYYFTNVGFILTLAGVVLAAIKVSTFEHFGLLRHGVFAS